MSKQASTARWLTLCVVGILGAFIAYTLYSRKINAEVDDTIRSITENSSASVVYLATVTEDIRLISARATLSMASTPAEDRTRIDSLVAEMDDAIRLYRSTEDYPGEHEVYLKAEALRQPFLSAADQVLATAADGGAPHASAVQRFAVAASELASTIRQLTQINAVEVANEGASITETRRHARSIFMALRLTMVVLAIAGILLSWFTSRQQIALVESNEHLAEERAKELEMFAGRVAHDLRSPLAVIEMKSVAADRSDAPETARSALLAIRRQGRRMQEIIDALLTFAQAGATPAPESCDNIEEVVRDVLGDIESVVPDSGIEFIVEPIDPATAGCSSRVLGIVLSNLVGNAAKYIGAGREGVRRVTLRMRQNGARLQFEVEDNGPGLPSGTELKVFEPFVRVSRSSVGGIGLGLATVKRLIEAHGGVVGVVSTPGSGCIFWFELPLGPGPESPRRPISDQSARAAS